MTKKINYLELPTKFLDDSKISHETTRECEKKLQESESMGLDPTKYCPECLEQEDDEESTILGYDYVDASDIKAFNKVIDDNKVVVEFYNGLRIKYEITIEEFLKKIGKISNIY